MSSNVKFVVRSKMTMTFENEAGENGTGAPGDTIPDPQVTFQAHVTRAVTQDGNEGDSLVTVDLPPPYNAAPRPADGVAMVVTAHAPECIAARHDSCPLAGIGSIPRPHDELRWVARKWSQYLATVLASLACMAIGYMDGWSAFAVPYFTSPVNPPTVTDDNLLRNASLTGTIVLADVIIGTTPLGGSGNDQATWICCLVAMGGILGAIPAGDLANIVGRKRVLMLMAAPCITAWAMILVCGDSIYGIYTSRIITGFVMGVISVVVPLYTEEISEVHSRGALVIYHHMMFTVGILLAYIIGFLLPISVNTILPCVIPVAILMFLPAMPESPFYLLRKGRFEETKQALSFLRGPWLCLEYSAADVTSQVTRAVDAAEASDGMRAAPLRVRLMWAARRFCANRGVQVAFGIMIYRQLSGINAVAFYAVEVFSGADSTITEQQSAILIGAVEVCATFLASLAVDKVGRRPLLLLSSLGMAIAHSGMTLYFTMMSDGHDMTNWWWVPVLMLSTSIVMYSLGFGPIPWLLMVELTPPEDKAWATSVAGVLNFGFMFIIMQLFSMVSAMIGSQYAFLFFSVFCVMGHVYVHNCLPETKGLTQEEIQRRLKKGSTSFLTPIQ